MSIGGNIASSILGNPKKAFLVIHKNPKKSSTDVAKETEHALEYMAALGDMDKGMFKNMFPTNSHVLQVQYNPSSISFQANATHIPMQRLQQNVVSEIPAQFQSPPSVIMSVQLVFDAVNVKDSFMMDKFRPSPGDAVTDVAAVINRNKYTVQPQTNGLLAMLMRNETSLVTFHWSNMTFHGEVSEVQARYTMFSVSGAPVRSTVQFNIKQNVRGNGDSKYWQKAFDNCFGKEDSTKDSGGINVYQAVGNLMNFGF